MKMPEETIEARMFAPCGMNCMVCYKHCNHKKPCAGCLVDDSGKPGHCRTCKIKDCVHGKGLSHCFACTEFPCRLIQNLEKSYTKRYRVSLVGQGEFVRLHGLEKFMDSQKRIYTCPQCGGILSLHDRTCSECNEPMT